MPPPPPPLSPTPPPLSPTPLPRSPTKTEQGSNFAAAWFHLPVVDHLLAGWPPSTSSFPAAAPPRPSRVIFRGCGCGCPAVERSSRGCGCPAVERSSRSSSSRCHDHYQYWKKKSLKKKRRELYKFEFSQYWKLVIMIIINTGRRTACDHDHCQYWKKKSLKKKRFHVPEGVCSSGISQSPVELKSSTHESAEEQQPQQHGHGQRSSSSTGRGAAAAWAVLHRRQGRSSRTGARAGEKEQHERARELEEDARELLLHQIVAAGSSDASRGPRRRTHGSSRRTRGSSRRMRGSSWSTGSWREVPVMPVGNRGGRGSRRRRSGRRRQSSSWTAAAEHFLVDGESRSWAAAAPGDARATAEEEDGAKGLV